ncbi:MAG: beta-N-acetylglucosaminidase domain-containing protein [Bacteroidaceae bacterium]|nr:beta-N-acetylglucosaminidase domain-containing protein [Bacteroidaceae bacterium]
MNKKVLTLSLMLMASLGATAQVSLVNPVPQEVTVATENAIFDAPAAWSINAAKAHQNGYIYDALMTASPKVAKKANFKVTLGVRGESQVNKYKKNIPAKSEGYYMKVTEKEVVIAGNDEKGLYYGVQTLLGMMKEGKLEACTITDWPDVPFRGTVEGFYGTPWSHEARKSQLEFYGRNKMNVYIYGPKDDPWHRDKWREPYPEAEANRIAELVNVAKANGVNFYWAIHPGVDIKWNDEDRDYLMAKLEIMYQLGVRSFAVFFDDIWGEGAKADKQAALLNYIDDNFVQVKKDVAPLILCPTEYNKGWANEQGGYLRTLGANLNKGIEVMWTGNSVVACIDKPTMEWINERIERKGYIWLNFPVNDFVRDHILMGPAYGNGLDIATDVSGFVSNPMEYAETSKISLYGIADYCWNMEEYDYQSNWEKSLKDILPSNHEALRIFALYNKDLGPNGHGFRREEGEELKDIVAAVEKGDFYGIAMLNVACCELEMACDILLNDNSNPQLLHELRPWIIQGKNLAAYGRAVCTMKMFASMQDNSTAASPFISFENLYNQARSLQKQMFDLENNKAMRHPYQIGTKLGTKVMLPTLNKLFTAATKEYNDIHGTDLNTTAEYNPFKLTSTVTQLALLPVKLNGDRVEITPALEVINWQAGGELMLESETPVTFQGMDFNFGVNDVAKHFKLELFVNGAWKEVSLLHYSENDPVIHTGNELGGMTATKLRITNKSGEEQKVYFRSFSFVRR